MTGRAFVTACAAAVVVSLGGTAPTVAAEYKIIQKDKTFSEKTLTIKRGDTITFVNSDTVTHNVYSNTKGCEFELRTQLPGGADTVPFPRACALEVQCAIHPKMKLQVDVK
jgi:plastocyanin